MNQNSTLTIPVSAAIERLQALRSQLRKHEIDGYLIPMADEYQNEYVPASERRVRFICDFTGTSGFITILMDRAAFFTDGRYTIQAQDQVDAALFEIFNIAQKTPSEWLYEHLRTQMKIGFDPRLHTAEQIQKLEIIALKRGACLVPTQTNLVDAIWTDRPAPVVSPVTTHDTTYAGKESTLKRHEIGAWLADNNLNAVMLTDPASIAWLLNVRGNDIPFTPLPLSMAILRADGCAEWFIDPAKAGPSIDHALGHEVTRHTPAELQAAFKRLGEARCRVLVDPKEASFSIVSQLNQSGAHVEYGDNPCVLPRACKNMTEIDGMRAAHRRDGAALVRLMAWLDSHSDITTLTEIDIEEKLAEFRAKGSLYKGPSFATIAGSGPNGAIVHYRAKKETARNLDLNSFLLLDSGAQYLDGTTDVTRTIPLGSPSQEMRDRYTRVLKGHIALASVRFPEGTTGADLDVLARQYLWDVGLDYAHGTGHGVGSYLSVHEGPHSISRRGAAPLHIGMVTSNEPGFYKARHYGIRLENLQHVVELFELGGPERKMFGFEPLTLVPFDLRAIEIDLLSKQEKAWLNAYHTRVHKALRPQLDEATGQWLANATKTI